MIKEPCCGGFLQLADNAGRKGLAVVAVHDDEGGYFRLESRGVDIADEDGFRKSLFESAYRGKFRKSEVIAISYCPFCGTRVS